MAAPVIVKYGNEALRVKAHPVETVDEPVRRLVSDMLAAMYREEGVGLAAEQIGRQEAICVIDVPAEQAGGLAMPLVLINPRILGTDGEQTGQEGCLSFPGIYVNISRAEKVRFTYTDLQGRERTEWASGLLSRAVQHELDHLNGVLLVDRMSPMQKVAHAGRLKRLKRGLE